MFFLLVSKHVFLGRGENVLFAHIYTAREREAKETISSLIEVHVFSFRLFSIKKMAYKYLIKTWKGIFNNNLYIQRKSCSAIYKNQGLAECNYSECADQAPFMPRRWLRRETRFQALTVRLFFDSQKHSGKRNAKQ